MIINNNIIVKYELVAQTVKTGQTVIPAKAGIQ